MEYGTNGGTMTATLIEKKSWVEEKEVATSSSVACFVLLENSEDFHIDEKSYNIKILGQPMFTWVCRACPSIPVTIESMKDSSPLEIVRPYLKDSEYTVILYSDTPLVTRSTIDEIIEYVKIKGLNVCKLTRGWVFKTDYVKRVGEVFAPQTYYFDEEDFIMAVNFKQLQMVGDILRSRILDFHMKNGVYFTMPDKVEVDANVSIGKNTVIDGSVRLLGKTQIGENCTIVNSTIQNSKVFDRVNLDTVILEKSVVESDVTVGSMTSIFDGSLVNKNSVIGKNNVVKQSSIGENVKIGDSNNILFSRIQDLCSVGSANVFAGCDHKVVRLLSNAKVQNGSKLSAGVTIGESVSVSDFKFVESSIKQGDGV